MEETAVDRRTGRTATGRALLVLALLAFAVSAAPADAQSPTYSIPLPPPPAPPPPPPPPPPLAEPAMMRPFPTVRTAGSFSRGATRFTRIAVKAPAGSVVRTSCRRVRCTSSRTVRNRRTLRLRGLERAFAPKTVIEIRITAPGVIGKHVELRIRTGRPPLRRDRCLPPGERPVPCRSA
jgi:hypothetical protein